MKGIFLFTVVMLSFAGNLHAQITPKNHADSTKELLTFLLKRDYFYNEQKASISANAIIDYHDSGLFFRINSEPTLNKNGFKLHKYIREADHDKAIDSIFITAREVQYINDKWHHPDIPKWDTTFFPADRIITQNYADSFFKVYFLLGKESGDTMQKYNYDDTKFDKSPIFEKLKTYQNYPFWEQGYIKISDPVFFKKGQFAIILFWHYWGKMFITYSMTVYKRTETGWQPFSCIQSGNIN